MNVTYRVDKDILYIAIEGRIDATNAAEAEEKIFAIKTTTPASIPSSTPTSWSTSLPPVCA